MADLTVSTQIDNFLKAPDLPSALWRSLAFLEWQTFGVNILSSSVGNFVQGSEVDISVGSTGSAAVEGSTPQTILGLTGTTPGSRFVAVWPDFPYEGRPGFCHYHFLDYGNPIAVAFRFGFQQTLSAGACLFGYFGAPNDASNYPTDPTWDSAYSGFGFMIKGDGSLTIFINNQVTQVFTKHLVAGVTIDVSGLSGALVQRLIFITDGLGNVSVYLNSNMTTPVATYGGLPIIEGTVGNHPFMGFLNEPSGTAVNNQIFIWPLKVANAP